MSAFLCSPLHIGAICTWAEANGVIANRERAATILVKANIESMECRYGDRFEEDHGADYILACQEETPERPAVDIWKLCRSLAYQSCEHDGYDGSPADELCQKICAAAAAALGVYMGDSFAAVPGGDDAPWSI